MDSGDSGCGDVGHWEFRTGRAEVGWTVGVWVFSGLQILRLPEHTFTWLNLSIPLSIH